MGDTDFAEESFEYILGNFVIFMGAVWPNRVNFAGDTRKKGLNPAMVSNTVVLSDWLGKHYKNTKLIKIEDFHYRQYFH